MMVAFQTTFIFPAAFALLPSEMDTREARALIAAIGLQESCFVDRRQVLDSGAPGAGRGWYQFELGGGVLGVLTHAKSKAIARQVLDVLGYNPAPKECYVALEHNDVLAACFARLLLWTDAERLPGPEGAAKAWKIYERTWKPGRPHPDKWPANHRKAWALVDGEAS